jgi:pimeloyl-ACP methyl ester carboxylesterase
VGHARICRLGIRAGGAERAVSRTYSGRLVVDQLGGRRATGDGTFRRVPHADQSYFSGRDGVRLAYREVGEGRPLVLLHGITSDATLWLRHGTAEAIAGRGYRVIMPDFRGHGGSAKPHDAAAYPPDVLTDDAFALLDHLGLDHLGLDNPVPEQAGQGGYDLGGYSLGARIVVRMLVRGATPGRAVVAGQGLREVLGVGGGAGSMLRRVFGGWGTFEPGSPEARTEQWLRSNDEDPVAIPHVLDSIAATPVEQLGEVRTPTLVLMGADDERAVSAEQLVAALPHGALAEVPGDHRSALATPEFTKAILGFLDDR